MNHWVNPLLNLTRLSTHLLSITCDRPQETTISVHRRDENGWVDFFLGEVSDAPCYRLLDCKAKIGLHYQASDLEHLTCIDCPSPEIPSHLWQELKDLGGQYVSNVSRFSRYALMRHTSQI